MTRITLGTILAIATLVGCVTSEQLDANMAEIHCETWVSQQLGIPTDDLQFDHLSTPTNNAPSYTVVGTVVGGGRTRSYRCDVTFDGDETWTLDGIAVT